MPQGNGTGSQSQCPQRERGPGLFGTDREGIQKYDENAGFFGRLGKFFDLNQRGTGGGQGRGKGRRRGRQGRGRNRS